MGSPINPTAKNLRRRCRTTAPFGIPSSAYEGGLGRGTTPRQGLAAGAVPYPARQAEDGNVCCTQSQNSQRFFRNEAQADAGNFGMSDLFDNRPRRNLDGGRVISIRGAREHNLKNIDLEIPRDRLVVFTGLSGSGKSSLAFDTIYAEGQRRYVESLSAYARQFLEMMQKPDV